MQLGLYNFVDLTADPNTGDKISPADRMRNLLEEIKLADEVGLDVYGIGEHHRSEYISSAPAVILAAAAAITERIRLTSAVTVLSSEDPVRAFQQFATLDLVSNGRAELMAGRGSFIESFPLFGYDLDDYDTLFAEKLDLLLALRDSETVSWSGTTRPPLQGEGIYPRPVQDPLPVWIAVGGTPASVIRAGTLGLPLAIAIIGGMPSKFGPLVELYREAARRAGHDADALPVSINSHGYIAETTEKAADEAYPYHEVTMNKIGRERGWPPMDRKQFDLSYSPHGALVLGSPEAVAEKIVAQHRLFNHDRFLLQMSVATMPHSSMMRAIELYGTEVVPAVRKALA